MRFGGDQPYEPDDEVQVIVSAFEVMPDGTKAPIGEPRERTISQGALDLLHGEGYRQLADRRQAAREAAYDGLDSCEECGKIHAAGDVEAAIETATRVRVTDDIVEAAQNAFPVLRDVAEGKRMLEAAFAAAGFEVEE